MRQRAIDLGFSLNEHRLINKETKEVVCLTCSKTYISLSGMKFKEPNERINANSVELLDSTETQEIFKIKKKNHKKTVKCMF